MPDDSAKRFAHHLGFLGYTTSDPGADGWARAEHPRRWNIHFLPTPLGLRLHCTIHLGDHVALQQPAWLAFVNRFNDDAIVARTALAQDADGDWFLRVRALLPPAYDRRLHGALLDAWHSDLEYMQHAPARHDAPPVADEAETIN